MKKLFVLLLLLTSVAKAGFYLEPYAGYTLGRYQNDFTQTAPTAQQGSSDAAATGFTYGGKVGLSLPVLTFGVDYLGSALTIAGQANISEDIGAFARVSLLLVDLTGSYFATSKLKNTDTTSSGNGYKLGVGMPVLPFLHVNLDYVFNHYGAVNPTAPTAYAASSGNMSRLIFTASIPLDF